MTSNEMWRFSGICNDSQLPRLMRALRGNAFNFTVDPVTVKTVDVGKASKQTHTNGVVGERKGRVLDDVYAALQALGQKRITAVDIRLALDKLGKKTETAYVVQKLKDHKLLRTVGYRQYALKGE